MGDRALVIFKTNAGESATIGQEKAEYSPVVYLHWHGQEVPELLDQLEELMAERKGDVSYSAARFIGICHEEIDGNLSLGTWSLPEDFEETPDQCNAMSHGDNGVFVVDANTFSYTQYG